MAKQTAGFVDQHIEKVVLGVCAAIFLGTAVYYFAVGPYKLEDKDPKKLIENARQVAEETQNRVRSAPPYVPAKEGPTTPIGGEPLKVLARWFGAAADGLIAIAGIDPKSPRTQAFPPPLLAVHGVAEEDKLVLAKLAPPGAPIVMSGHAYLEMPAPTDFDAAPSRVGPPGSGESRERSWVSVAAQVNLAEQFKSFLAAGYPHGNSMSMPIIRVHLQRKVVGEKGEKVADWEEVTPYTAYKRIALPELSFLPNGALDGTSLASLTKFGKLIRDGQDSIARAPLPPKTQGTRGDEPIAPPLPYMDAPPGTAPSPSPMGGTTKGDPIAAGAIQRAKEWLGFGSKALAGQKPFADPDPELAHLLARAASVTKGITPADADKAKKLMQDAEAAAKSKRPIPTATPEEPEHLMPILAHDLDVTPGRKYVYHIRYEILNPLLGSTKMRDPADARKMTLVSDWSPESREVEVRSDIFYFLTKADAKTQTAEFTVYKKVPGGDFEKEAFKVGPGEMVGGKKKNVDFSTHKVFVLIEATRGAKAADTRVILADAVDGNLSEHWLSKEANDRRMDGLTSTPKRKRG